jgi:hypothetical protein
MMLALSTRDNTVVEEVTLQVRPHCAEPLLPARWRSWHFAVDA